MRPLDPKTLLAETLKPYATGARHGLPGLFERYLLEPGDDDHDAIDARMGDVKAIWDKNLEHTRYGELAKALSAEHDDAGLALLDPAERARLAAEVERERSEAAEHTKAALEEWRALLGEYVAGAGLTPGARATLERIAKSKGIDAALVQEELDQKPAAAPPPVLAEDVRRQIQKSLHDLARVVGEERLALSLYHAIGLDGITEDAEAVRSQYDKVHAQNQARGFGQTATAYKTVLANVRLHLLDADPRAYVEGLRRDIATEMELEVARSATDGVIDPTEAESLLQGAMRRGLTAELGRQLISEVAREHGARLEVGAAVDYVACSKCNTPHPRTSAADACKRCGTDLFRSCPVPGCDARNEGTALRCGECGTDLFKFTEATRRRDSLSEAVEGGRIGWAAGEVEEVGRVLGEAAVPQELRRRLDGLMAEAQASWAAVESAIAERRLFEARRLLRELARVAGDVPGPTGDLPPVRAQEVDRRLAEVDAALARARTSSGPAREAALCDALALAEDCEEAASALADIPPQPPGAVEVELGDGGPLVSWAPSGTAGARYSVRRVDAGSNASAGVAATAATRYEDLEAPSGAVVRYEVATIRGRARSEPAHSPPLLVAREVQDLAVVDGDGEVRLSWQPVPVTARVVVRRSCQRDRERELTAGRSGVVDSDVENGQRYAYRVAVEYGDAASTAGVTVYGQPAPPPQGIEALSIQPEADGVRVDFDWPPAGTVSIVRCEDEPAISCGDRLDPGALQDLGEVLVADRAGVRDRPSSGVCWYLPVTIAGGVAVAGQAVRHLALPEMTNVTAVEASGEVRLTWEWPDGVRIAKVVWRRDRQPMAPDEPGTESAWVRSVEYRDNSGFVIDGAPGTLFAAVLPGMRIDGELVAGASIAKGSRAAVRSAPRADLRYAVRRVGMRRKRLEVEVEAPPGVTPPPLLLVGRSGDLLPRAATEGDVLARLGGDRPLSSSVDLSGRSRPLTVRLFLASDSSPSRFELFDPDIDDLLIR